MEEKKSIDDILLCLLKTHLFSEFDISGLEKRVENISYLNLPKGYVLVEEGASSDHLYVVVKGTLTVSINKGGDSIVVKEIGPNEIIGEVALLLKEKRTATVRTKEPSEVLRINYYTFREMLRTNPKVYAKVRELALNRLKVNQFDHYLARFFGIKTLEGIETIEKDVKWMELRKGEILFNAGDPSDMAYIIIQGRLSLEKIAYSGEKKRIADKTIGDIVGELEAIADIKRSCSAIAVRDTTLVAIPAKIYTQIQLDNPAYTPTMLKELFGKFKREVIEFSHQLPPKRTIMIIPNETDVPHREFASKLASELLRTNFSPLIIDTELLREELNFNDQTELTENSAEMIIFLNYLSKMEKEHNIIILVGNSKVDNWSSVCTKICDEIVWVAEANRNPEKQQFERDFIKQITPPIQPQRLILLHDPATTSPANTNLWLKDRNLIAHHHVRWGNNQTDVARVGRFLTNRAIGVVFSGGGARALAHLGVIKALEETKIPVDYVAGTNIGALIGSFLAQELSFQKSYNTTVELLKKFIVEITFPTISLFSGRNIKKSLDLTFKNIYIEDFWIPYFALSANVTRASSIQHNCGLLADALLASNSIPGLVPPFVLDGDLLVDGAVLNSFPIDLMREKLQGGFILGSEVNPTIDLENNYYANYNIPLKDLLFTKMSKNKDYRLPDIAHIIYRSMTLNSISHRDPLFEKFPPDVLLKHQLAQFDPMNFDNLDEILARGYECAINRFTSLSLDEKNRLLTGSNFETRSV